MFESVDGDGVHNRDFQSHFPAVDLSNKHYSLQPDIAMGWRPRNKIMGPVPLNCDARLLDEIVDQLTSFGSRYRARVIYLGHRFQSSFKMHQQMQRNYSFKYEGAMGGNYQHMAAYFRKFHANFKSKNTRIFKGMNPTIKAGEDLIFDSNFESGNLDTVIKVGENQYDLFMRIDTNTRGHLQWFNFRVKNMGKKKVKFNIVNFQKAKTLYQRGMKPYVYSQYLKQTKEMDWFQGGDNVKYSRKKLIYQFLEDWYEHQQITLYCLEFNYTFEVDWQEVQFAYSPPFTYSEMAEMIVQIKRSVYDILDPDQQSTPDLIKAFIKEENLCESLSGLEIPLLTVTDPKVDNKLKKCILVSGRIHPGESCSSFMGKGLLNFICSDSEQAKFLRRNVVFKIIPMLNPDGVVIGNFRTSLCGRDLNRTFKMNNDFLIPQVRALKQLVLKLKNEYKNRLIFFLDLHGHSVKKNVFLYGPEYEIWQTNYYKTRIFPKILANKTDIFRYYSCIFRVAQFKKATARAVILRNVPHCYTIEASTGFYYCPTQKKDIPFTPDTWMLMGRVIGEGIKEYIQLLNEQNTSRQQRKQKIISIKNMKNNRIQSRKNTQKMGSNKFQSRMIVSSSLKPKNTEDNEGKKNDEDGFSKKILDIIESIKQDERKFQEEKHEQGHQSDQFSEGGSDSEAPEDDIPETQLNQFEDQIFSCMQEFRQKFYRQKKEERQFSYKEPKKKGKDQIKSVSRKQSRGIEMVPSLKKKNETIEKAREVLVWNKLKQQFRDIKTGGNEDHLQSRLLLGRGDLLDQTFYKQKYRKINIQSEILNRRQTMGGANDFRSHY